MEKIILVSLLLITAIAINAQENDFPKLTGPYLGQKPPGLTPEIFAPGIISTGLSESTCAISPDGNEIYVVVSIKAGNKFLTAIVETKLENGIWTKPEVAKFSGKYQDHGPFIDPSGKRFYFASNRPVKPDSNIPGNTNIWFMEKEDGKWGNPKPMSSPINGDFDAMSATVSHSGTLYFTISFKEGKQELYRSKLINNKYSSIERLPDIINTGKYTFDGCISPDESYMVFCIYDKEDSFGSTDYYVSFRDKNDNWTFPVNLGNKINTKDVDCTPTISADGKYLFLGGHLSIFQIDELNPIKYNDFTKVLNSSGCGGFDILWVSSKIIEDLKPKE